MGTGEYPVRQSQEAAGTGLPDGAALYNLVEDEAGHRVPQVTRHDASPAQPEGGGGQNYLVSILRLARSVLPLRQGEEGGRGQEFQGCPDARDRSRASVGNPDGGYGEKKDGEPAGQRAAGDGAQDIGSADGEVEANRRLRQSQEAASRCFLDSARMCEPTCHAFTKEVREPCKILYALDFIVAKARPGRPIAPPPKVT